MKPEEIIQVMTPTEKASGILVPKEDAAKRWIIEKALADHGGQAMEPS